MEVFGDRRYVQIPGDQVYELPPLLVKESRGADSLNDMVGRAESIVENDWLMPDDLPSDAKTAQALERRRVGLAVNLAEQYVSFLTIGLGANPSSNGSASARLPSRPARLFVRCSSPMSGPMPVARASSPCSKTSAPRIGG